MLFKKHEKFKRNYLIGISLVTFLLIISYLNKLKDGFFIIFLSFSLTYTLFSFCMMLVYRKKITEKVCRVPFKQKSIISVKGIKNKTSLPNKNNQKIKNH